MLTTAPIPRAPLFQPSFLLQPFTQQLSIKHTLCQCGYPSPCGNPRRERARSVLVHSDLTIPSRSRPDLGAVNSTLGRASEGSNFYKPQEKVTFHPIAPMLDPGSAPGRAWLRAGAVEGRGQSTGLGSAAVVPAPSLLKSGTLRKSVTSLTPSFLFCTMGLPRSSLRTLQS